jgi:hypothetical protein
MNNQIVSEFFGLSAAGFALWELRVPEIPPWLCGLLAALWAMSAVGFVTSGHTVGGVLYGVGAAIMAWIWWHRRPPRKRRPSKTLAAIWDLGHRLVVTS